MPQMSPLMWLILFSLFSAALMISMVKTYFNNIKAPSNEQKPINQVQNKYIMAWKW
uniref:ATP synthase complex subunit 8 n=1 Tax=Orchesella cincta TaxID=48709 RepID=A0A1L2E1E0_ORCCI|nr:ATP synthase F0 subunit 8 [Orchesella cincta]ANJ04210.1 ATP synthase F0 subunit 8 [Orchesella cincta]